MTSDLVPHPAQPSTMRLVDLSLEEAAKAAAGNWRKFDCFVWFRDRELDDADDWAIIYTQNRDSALLDQSNASVINEAMRPFSEGDDPDVVFESHSHWAVGHVDGFSVRVLKRGRVTKAFRTYFDLEQQMDVYPVLDESDYSDREYEAALESIEDGLEAEKRSRSARWLGGRCLFLALRP